MGFKSNLVRASMEKKTERKPFFRVISGKFRGKKLSIPPEDITRPAKDRVREAVFNRLALKKKDNGGPLLQSAWVLDTFAGSGSMGIEALSRGAEVVYMLDKHPAVINILKKNSKKLKDKNSIKFLNIDILDIPVALRPMDLIFVDPPYFQKLIFPTLNILKKAGWVQQKTIILAEIDKTEDIVLPQDFVVSDERSYGRVKIMEIFLS